MGVIHLKASHLVQQGITLVDTIRIMAGKTNMCQESVNPFVQATHMDLKLLNWANSLMGVGITIAMDTAIIKGIAITV